MIVLVDSIVHFPAVKEIDTNLVLNVVQLGDKLVVLVLVYKRFPLCLEELRLSTHLKLDSHCVTLHLLLDILENVLELTGYLEVAFEV